MNTLIPKAVKVAINRQVGCIIPTVIGYTCEDLTDECVKAFQARCGKPLSVGDWLTIRKNNELPEESYRLLIEKDGVRLEAGTERGAGWGLTTLYHMMEESETLPTGTVEDYPRYAHRGLSLDCARHFFPVQEVEKIIEQISLVKMNVLHWHLSDDQGWRIESHRYPKLHEVSGSYYTQDEIREIVAYAKERGVEIIPEIDLPGHTLGILAAYPQYSCTGAPASMAKSSGIYRKILCAGKEETLSFVENLLDEVCGLFPGKYFHIGGDEAPKLAWKECPHCRQRMKQLGITDYEELQGDFTCRIARFLEQRGKQPVCWNDTLKSSLRPEHLTVQYWSVSYNKEMAKFCKEGGRWIYSDMFELYLDYPYAMTPVKKIYECTPDFGSAEYPENNPPAGMEACIWAEHIKNEEQLERLLFPRIYALAEIAWSGRDSYEEFARRLQANQLLLKKNGVCTMEQEGWDPEGQNRQQEAFQYMASLQEVGLPDSEEKADHSPSTPEFGQKFMNRFFRQEDIPILMQGLQ